MGLGVGGGVGVGVGPGAGVGLAEARCGGRCGEGMARSEECRYSLRSRRGVVLRCFGTQQFLAYNQRKLRKPEILCFVALLIASSHGFQQLLKVHDVKHVDQKAFAGG